MEPMLPWWQCAAVVFEDADEIDLDLETQAATAGEAEDIARAEWADQGIDVDVVKVRRADA